MAFFNFLKQVQVYLVHGGNQYLIDVGSISFSQTFTEQSTPVKTLHEQNMFERSTINKANPANFELSVNVLRNDDHNIIYDRLLDYGTFDLYAATEESVYKLTTCVLTNGSFDIKRDAPLSVKVSGQATKLSKVGTAGSYTIPGIAQVRASRQYVGPVQITAELEGSDISTELVGLSIELQNEINWNKYTTVQGAIGATDAANSMFPSTFTVSKRILAGNIRKYITGSNADDLLTWSTDTSLLIRATDDNYGFEFDMSNCSFTNRLEVAEIFIQTFDWRMTENPNDLTNTIKYHYIN